MNFIRLIFFAIVIIHLVVCSTLAQDCYNSNFETGDASGYMTYIGGIDSDGNIVIDSLINSPNQHRIMSFTEGFDPIAEMNCIENIELPVVPPLGGRYAMRLGNSQAGAQAERALINFTVTDETSFFLLRYAVVLNDPGHQFYEQPRFELTILDENGDAYPCGEYAVRAGPDIPNFENCNSWRVRPWTAIGIELQSYLGQEIQIQLLTTDCSRGGHAGYAYFDATCQPLEIQLLNYCEGSTTAIMQVTPGFDRYLWNTGDTTSIIQIDNPQAGDIYSVLVTSATGCDLLLSDTIPVIDIIVPPVFDPPTLSQFCRDTQFWFRPAGENLTLIYSPDLGQFQDSFYIQNDVQNIYTFVAYSDFGCGFDTVIHEFYNAPRVDIEIDHVECYGLSDGQIKLSPIGSQNIVSYEWRHGSNDNELTNLSGGNYFVTITDDTGCDDELTIRVNEPSPLGANINIISADLCAGMDNGVARIFAYGGIRPYLFSYDLGVTFVSEHQYDQYHLDSNLVIIQDDVGCLDSIYVEFKRFIIDDIIINHTICNENNGSIRVGLPTNFTNRYSLDGVNYQANSVFDNLSPGAYNVYVMNEYGCKDSASIFINPSILPSPADSIVHINCFDDNTGGIYLQDTSNSSYRYLWADGQRTNAIENQLSGTYSVIISDVNRCVDTLNYTIEQNKELDFTIEEINPFVCPDHDEGAFIIHATGGMPPYTFSIDNGLTFATDSIFLDLEARNYPVVVIDSLGCSHTISYEIQEFLIPDIVNLRIDMDTCDLSKGLIEVLAINGGEGPYMYSIDSINYQVDSIFENLPFGYYTIYIKDNNACIGKDSVEILLLEQVNLTDVLVTHTLCDDNNGELQLVTNNNFGNLYSVNQSNIQTDPVFNNLSDGSYTVMVFNEFGCEDSVTTFINPSVLPIPIETIVHVNCNRDSTGTIQLESPLGVQEYSYSWPNGQTSNYIEGLAAGSYMVNVEDSDGCINMINYIIEENSEMIISIDEVRPFTCPDQNHGSFGIDASGGTPPYSYSFDNGLTFDSLYFISDLEAGLYSIVVKDSLNCQKNIQYEIQTYSAPEIMDIELSMDTCGLSMGRIEILTINGGLAPYLYSLDSINYQVSPVFDGLSSGNYSIYYKDENECGRTESVDIILLEPVQIIDLSVVHTSCDLSNGTVELQTDNNFENTYSIDRNLAQLSPKFENITSGFHSILVRNRYGCTDSIDMVINSSETLEITDVLTTYSPCQEIENVIDISVQNGLVPYLYSIDNLNFQLTPMFANLSPGMNRAYVKDANNCLTMYNFEILDFQRLEILDTELMHPDCGQNNGHISFDIIGGFGEVTVVINNETFPASIPIDDMADGTYQIIIQDQSDCEILLDAHFLSNCELYIPNSFTPNGDGINDKFRAYANSFANGHVHSLQIFDRWGSTVYEQKSFDLNNDLSWWDGTKNGEHYPLGVFIYIIDVEFGNGQRITYSGDVTLIR